MALWLRCVIHWMYCHSHTAVLAKTYTNDCVAGGRGIGRLGTALDIQCRTVFMMKLNERISPKKQKEKKIEKKEPKKLVKKKEVKKKQTEVTQKLSQDKTPPKILIANNLKFKSPSYKIEGMVQDEGSKIIYVEIDGIIQNAEKGKFVFERFSPIDETVKIVAIDQWGNRSKEKIVKIEIDTSNKKIVKKLEKLNPENLNTNQINRNSVAVVIGIEKYERTPQASFANRDAKYFYEYARKGFGIPKANELPFQNQWESKGPLFLYLYNFLSFLSNENLIFFKIINSIHIGFSRS